MANGFLLTATAEPEVANPLVKTLSGLFGLLMIVGVGVGLAGFFVGHEHMFNNTREVPWGLLISTYAFFAITSTGLCLLAAISHVFGGNKLAWRSKALGAWPSITSSPPILPPISGGWVHSTVWLWVSSCWSSG